jgi:hypothetical protein
MPNEHEGKTEAEIVDVFFRCARGALSALQALAKRGSLSRMRPALSRLFQEFVEVVK